MKKTYKTPYMRSINLDLEQIIAGSNDINMDVNTETPKDAGNSLSRDNSTLWDEEW